VAIRSIGSPHRKLAVERHDHVGRVEAFHSVEGAAVRCRHTEQLPLFVADINRIRDVSPQPRCMPIEPCSGVHRSQRRQSQGFGPQGRTDTRHHKPPPQLEYGPFGNAPKSILAVSVSGSISHSFAGAIRTTSNSSLSSRRIAVRSGGIAAAGRGRRDRGLHLQTRPGQPAGRPGRMRSQHGLVSLAIHDVLGTGSDFTVAVSKLNSPFLARWVLPRVGR
jgi:hypothetical protein